EKFGVPLFRVTRGGDATFHGPGQLVAYPILSLEHEGRDLHRYLRQLEDVLMSTLDGFGISSERIAGRTGVWVAGRKIASIGIGVRRWVSYHGVALNVATDLECFRAIVPCAIPGVEVTSMARELHSVPDFGEVQARFIEAFAEV